MTAATVASSSSYRTILGSVPLHSVCLAS
jgi:hypothetical protein